MRTKIVIEKIELSELYECLESNNETFKSLTGKYNLSPFGEFRLNKSIERMRIYQERISFAENNGKDYVLIYNGKILNYFDINDMIYGKH